MPVVQVSRAPCFGKAEMPVVQVSMAPCIDSAEMSFVQVNMASCRGDGCCTGMSWLELWLLEWWLQ